MEDQSFDLFKCSQEYLENPKLEDEQKILAHESRKRYQKIFFDITDHHQTILDNLMTVMKHDEYGLLDSEDRAMFECHSSILKKHNFTQEIMDICHESNYNYFSHMVAPFESIETFYNIVKLMNETIDQCCKESPIKAKAFNSYDKKVSLAMKKRVNDYKRSILVARHMFNKKTTIKE